MFFEKQSKTHSPSIHEMRMELMFPSSNQKKKKKGYDFSSFQFKAEKAEISKKEISFVKQYVENIRRIDLRKFDLFEMTPETANEYYLYKQRKEGKNKTRNTYISFYEIDGSINYFKVFSGLFSENEFIKEKAIRILEENLGEFVRSQLFLDYFSMVFSCGLALFLLFHIFFNIPMFLEHYLSFLF